jgi:hypothetical protein
MIMENDKTSKFEIPENQRGRLNHLIANKAKAANLQNEAVYKIEDMSYKSFTQLVITSSAIAALAMTILGYLFDKIPNPHILGYLWLFKISIILLGLTIPLSLIRNYYAPNISPDDRLKRYLNADIKLKVFLQEQGNPIDLSEIEEAYRNVQKRSNFKETILNTIEVFSYGSFCTGIILLIIFVLMVLP